jgi:hypothetical protein
MRGDRLVTFGQKVGKESTISGVPGESSPIVFHERRQVSYILAERGKESTVSLDVYGESSPIVPREETG